MSFNLIDAHPHLTLDKYLGLSVEEKIQHAQEAYRQNKQAATQAYRELNSDWILTVSNQIVRYGTWDDGMPDEDELMEIGRQYGKPPFLFSKPIMVRF